MADGSVLQVADYGAPYSGNFVASLVRLREVLNDRLGLDSAIVFSAAARDRPWVKDVRGLGIPVAFLDRSRGRTAKIRSLRALAREHRSVLLHSHFRGFDTEAAVAARLVGGPCVLHLHSHFAEYSERPPSLRERLFWRIVGGRLASAIVAVSDFVADFAVGKGAPPGKIHIVPNGIDLSRVPVPKEEERAAARERLGLPVDARILLCFGWSPKTKGLDLLAGSLRRLRGPEDADVVCAVVRGEHNEEEVARSVAGLPAVRILAPTEDVASLYAAADVFVSASRAEGLPYSIGEAMASGLPVVSSDLPALVAAYRDAGEGFLTFPSGEPEALRSTLERALSLPVEELRRRGSANRSFIEANFPVGKWCDRIAALYADLLAARRQRT